MDNHFREFLKSGKHIITDTTTPKVKVSVPEKSKRKDALDSTETDPHKRFVKFSIKNKPDAKDIVKEFQRFVEQAEASA